MRLKSDAHESLPNVFTGYDVPLMIIFDGLKKQAQEKFRKILKEADCKSRVTEPGSPWQNISEPSIKN